MKVGRADQHPPQHDDDNYPFATTEASARRAVSSRGARRSPARPLWVGPAVPVRAQRGHASAALRHRNNEVKRGENGDASSVREGELEDIRLTASG